LALAPPVENTATAIRKTKPAERAQRLRGGHGLYLFAQMAGTGGVGISVW